MSTTIFTVRRSEIEGRLDPKYLLFLRNTHKFNYDIFPLKQYLTSKPQYGTAEVGIARESSQEPRYIRITDINDYGELNTSLGATAEHFDREYILNHNDMLFARSGSVGKTYLHKAVLPYDCFFAGYMIRIRVDQAKLLPDYLFVYTCTKPYRDWVNAVQRVAVQPNINAEEYASMPIPVPPLEIQHKIVTMYTEAQNHRRQKLAEAQNLLASIDDYLLGELGITLPQKDNSLKSRMFVTSSCHLIGTRWNCALHSDNFSLYSDKFASVRLWEISVINPSVVFLSNIGDLTFIPMEAIDEQFGEVTQSLTKPISETTGFTRFQRGDLIWAKITPCMQNGKSAVVRNTVNGYACGSTEFYVIRCDENRLDVEYLFDILHMKRLLEYATNYFGGNAGQQRVSKDFLTNLLIPLPSLAKQKEIAAHIQHIRDNARRLQSEAEQILHDAKHQVEQMILGE